MSDWRAQAVCREAPDPNIFFPVSASEPSLRIAKSMCEACPVQVECLQAALATGEREGIWAGLNMAEEGRELYRALERSA